MEKNIITGDQNSVVFARCDCCSLIEECTEEYIQRVRDRYSGRWICGLCSEAVKDEMTRSSDKGIGKEEALNEHMSFCNKFKTLSQNPTEELICALKQMLLKSLDSPRASPVRRPALVRSQSCRPSLESGSLKTKY